MFRRWDATHTTSPVFKFRLVVKGASAVKQSRSTDEDRSAILGNVPLYLPSRLLVKAAQTRCGAP